jgi:uncharacterized protein (TIGR03437 family)
MFKVLLVLGVLVTASARAQAPPPAYSAADIVNAPDYSPGPFAPNSVLTVFGSDLSWYTATPQGNQDATAPTQLGGVSVYVNTSPAPLLYVSGPQINFLIPSNQLLGDVTVCVVRQGVAGPNVTITLVNAAPALFEMGAGFAVATHADGTLLTDASPGQPGEIVVVYATGLGVTEPNSDPGEVPQFAATMEWIGSLNVSLDGAMLPSYLIKYAGVTPGWVGLYQLNIQLPQDVGTDPAIQVSVGPQSSSGTHKLAVL